MVAQFVATLERPVSRVRLENYRPPNGTDLAMVVNYFYNYNLELSEALYSSLRAFEIALRNSLHHSLSEHFQTEYWFDLPDLYPSPRPPENRPWQKRAIQDARDHLTKASKPHDANRIVAEMHLGFWHSLFNKPFWEKLWRPNRAALLQQVFPYTTRRQQNRQDLWDRIDRIRIIRNRVMHYEPIWYRPHLSQDHAGILEALAWISRDMHQSITLCDRFQQVLREEQLNIEARIRAEILRRYPPQ